MTVRETIIKGCEYWVKNHKNEQLLLEYSAVEDLLTMLKEQDAVKPKYSARTNWYECGNCHYSMTSGMHCRGELIPATKVRYCANCGFSVDWEGSVK